MIQAVKNNLYCEGRGMSYLYDTDGNLVNDSHGHLLGIYETG
ncbi:MAG: hypothetical protein QXI16_04600 [Sulfolobaceae archaeon]